MIDIIIQGIGGRMGHALVEKIQARQDCRVVAGIDQNAGMLGDIPVAQDLSELPVAGDVIIDFSSPAGAERAADYCTQHKLPCVFCTTGLSAEQEQKLKTLAQSVPVFRSANMSLGINAMVVLAQQAQKLLGSDFDIEIVEMHHRNKLDAPSGTALMLADGINETADEQFEYVYDRHAVRQKRGARELGISSVRGGGIVGEHEVLFCGPEETVTLSHSAQSRGVFADGAVQAALFLKGRAPGLYNMSDLIQEKMK